MEPPNLPRSQRPAEAVTRPAQSRPCFTRQEAYKATWAEPHVAQALAHASHLMVWSDNDVANDFSCMRGADGRQAYTPAYLRVAMTTYQWYQRSLWDPSYVPAPVAFSVPSPSRDTMEEGQRVESGLLAALQLASPASSDHGPCFPAALPAQENPWSHEACSQRLGCCHEAGPESLILHLQRAGGALPPVRRVRRPPHR